MKKKSEPSTGQSTNGRFNLISKMRHAASRSAFLAADGESPARPNNRGVIKAGEFSFISVPNLQIFTAGA